MAVSGGGGSGRRGVGMLVGEVLRGRLAIMGKLDFFFFLWGNCGGGCWCVNVGLQGFRTWNGCM